MPPTLGVAHNNQAGIHFSLFFNGLPFLSAILLNLKTETSKFGFSCAVLSWESFWHGLSFAGIGRGWGRYLRGGAGIGTNSHTRAKLSIEVKS